MEYSKLPGLYIHIPFCRAKCDYCSFYSLPVEENSPIVDQYLKRLIEELRTISAEYGRVSFDTVYFGGGTPSIISLKRFRELLDEVRALFCVVKDAEITVEMNPDDIPGDKIPGWIAAGVNRIVLGMQSTILSQRKIIGRMGRNPSPAELDYFFQFKNLARCLDFIGGIPDQEFADIDRDFEIISRYRPEHVSFYLLTVDENTPLASRIRPDEKFDNNQLRVWQYGIECLKKMGYGHYEVSNFALPGNKSRHNMKYWKFLPYIGAGPSAHSFYNNIRYSNPASLQDYLKPGGFRREIDHRDESSVVVEFVLTSTRNLDGFSPDDYRKITGKELPEVIAAGFDRMVSLGFMEKRNGLLRYTEKGLQFSDRIVYEIVESLL